jgi:hypothetical protein
MMCAPFDIYTFKLVINIQYANFDKTYIFLPSPPSQVIFHVKQLVFGKENNLRTQMQNWMLKPRTFHELQWQFIFHN